MKQSFVKGMHLSIGLIACISDQRDTMQNQILVPMASHCGTFKHVGGHKLLNACIFFLLTNEKIKVTQRLLIQGGFV